MKTVLPGQDFRFELDGRSLTIEDVVAFSRRSEYASCALSAEAVEKITATRALKRDLIGREVPIYGVTTGFGDSAHRQISASKTARLQQNMLRFLGSGTGPITSPEVTRAAVLLRRQRRPGAAFVCGRRSRWRSGGPARRRSQGLEGAFG